MVKITVKEREKFFPFLKVTRDNAKNGESVKRTEKAITNVIHNSSEIFIRHRAQTTTGKSDFRFFDSIRNKNLFQGFDFDLTKHSRLSSVNLPSPHHTQSEYPNNYNLTTIHFLCELENREI